MANKQDERTPQASTTKSNPGNFANDREKAVEAGRKGGQSSGGNFANDRQRASEAGRVGGQKSHRGSQQGDGGKR